MVEFLTQNLLLQVLVAGHLLQMPSVVSICEAVVSASGGGVGVGATASASSIGVDLCSPPLPPTHIPPALSVWRSLARLVPSTTTPAPNPTLVRPTPTRPQPSIIKLLSSENFSSVFICKV